MPNLTVRYYGRKTNKQVILELPTDVIAVEIPEQLEYNGQPAEFLPALTVHVNTDAVMIDTIAGRIGTYEYTELLAQV